jgi:hypothetical protein
MSFTSTWRETGPTAKLPPPIATLPVSHCAFIATALQRSAR